MWGSDKDFELCVGKEIVKHSLNAGGTELVLHFADGSQAVLVPEGDCCSSSWIESIDDEHALHGKVAKIEEIDMPDRGNVGTEKHPGVEEVKYYGLRITTDKGRSVIDYRNDSNGYYGGWLNCRIEQAQGGADGTVETKAT
jgi:hypothetical protein